MLERVILINLCTFRQNLCDIYCTQTHKKSFQRLLSVFLIRSSFTKVNMRHRDHFFECFYVETLNDSDKMWISKKKTSTELKYRIFHILAHNKWHRHLSYYNIFNCHPVLFRFEMNTAAIAIFTPVNVVSFTFLICPLLTVMYSIFAPCSATRLTFRITIIFLILNYFLYILFGRLTWTVMVYRTALSLLLMHNWIFKATSEM